MASRHVYGLKRQELKSLSADNIQAALDKIEGDLERLPDANAAELKEILVGVLQRQARIIRGLRHLAASSMDDS